MPYTLVATRIHSHTSVHTLEHTRNTYQTVDSIYALEAGRLPQPPAVCVYVYVCVCLYTEVYVQVCVCVYLYMKVCI